MLIDLISQYFHEKKQLKMTEALQKHWKIKNNFHVTSFKIW